MDMDAILVFLVYAQFCVCAIPRYPKYPVSAILDMCKYVQYMQYNHVLWRRSPRGDPGSPCQTCAVIDGFVRASSFSFSRSALNVACTSVDRAALRCTSVYV
jgi:hypothetical protein